MRVGIVSGSRRNQFAVLLLHRLVAAGIGVHAGVRVAVGFDRLADELLVSGPTPMLDRLLAIWTPAVRRSFRSDEARMMRECGHSEGVGTTSFSAAARSHDIPVTRVRSLSDSKSMAKIAALGCDVLVYGGGGIVAAGILAFVPVINGHSGPLPAVRGMSAAEWAVLAAAPRVATVHYMAERVDQGDVIRQVPIEREATSVGQLRAGALLSIVDGIVSSLTEGDLPAGTRQSRSGGVHYYRMHPRLFPFVESRLQRDTVDR